MSAFIEVDDRQVLEALRELYQLTGNLRPALVELGEDMVESTKRRFVTSTAPDGSDWALNSVLSTLLYKEGDKPLVNHGTLSDQIFYNASADELEVGSTMEYAAMMQFGGTKSEFPHLWGDIPARPFLGLSDQDRSDILTVLARHISQAIGG